MAASDRYGVLLTDNGWQELERALAPFVQNRPIGKFLYSKELTIDPPFATPTVMPAQVQDRIAPEMTIRIPLHHIAFIADGADANARKIGFV